MLVKTKPVLLVCFVLIFEFKNELTTTLRLLLFTLLLGEVEKVASNLSVFISIPFIVEARFDFIYCLLFRKILWLIPIAPIYCCTSWFSLSISYFHSLLSLFASAPDLSISP